MTTTNPRVFNDRPMTPITSVRTTEPEAGTSPLSGREPTPAAPARRLRLGVHMPFTQWYENPVGSGRYSPRTNPTWRGNPSGWLAGMYDTMVKPLVEKGHDVVVVWDCPPGRVESNIFEWRCWSLLSSAQQEALKTQMVKHAKVGWNVLYTGWLRPKSWWELGGPHWRPVSPAQLLDQWLPLANEWCLKFIILDDSSPEDRRPHWDALRITCEAVRLKANIGQEWAVTEALGGCPVPHYTYRRHYQLCELGVRQTAGTNGLREFIADAVFRHQDHHWTSLRMFGLMDPDSRDADAQELADLMSRGVTLVAAMPGDVARIEAAWETISTGAST